MICKRFEEGIVGLAFGELSAAEAAVVERHVQVCARCAKELETYRRTAALVARPPDVPEGSLSSERLRQSILSNELKAPAGMRWKFAVVGGLAALAAGVIGLTSGVLIQPGGPADSEGAVAIRDDSVVRTPAPLVDTAPEPEVAALDANPQAPEQSSPAPVRQPERRRNQAPVRTQNPSAPDEVHYAGNGAITTSAVRSSPPRAFEDAEVIVIQPGNGSATEMRSSDVAFGG